MITFKFEIEKQEIQYNKIKEKLKTGFYQNLKFYVLPYMPEKFRNRVIFLPEVCEPEKTYKKQKHKIDELEVGWNENKKIFIQKLERYFPKLNQIDIAISPVLYGSLGSYWLQRGSITVKPRYDRKIDGLQKLIITAVTHYFNYGTEDNLEDKIDIWKEKQTKAQDIENAIFPKVKDKSMVKILDTEFAGRLAQESASYLAKLRSGSKVKIQKPKGLTKSEDIVFDILLQNKNKLVSFDELADSLWKENSEDKYSEYAITKLVERLKKKVPPNSIQPQRGAGYILHI